MTWKVAFDKGVTCFKRGDLEQALAHMNQAIELENSNFIIYDSCAAVHEKLGNIKAALLDSKRVIELAPDRWQGYARSARLFNLLGKHGHAIKMADHALSHLRSEDVQRRAQLVELRENAVAAQGASDKQTSYLLGKLPVETLVEIFSLLIDEDHTQAIKLSHVCGHWRRILINTPSAWQTLVLSRKHPLRKAKLWKERAKNRIARIFVDMSELDRAFVFAQLQDLSWDDVSSLRISGNAFIELHKVLSYNSHPHAFSNLDELNLFDYTSPDQLICCLSGPDWKLRVLRLSGTIHMVDEWWQRVQRLKEIHLNGSISAFSPLVFAANPSLETFVLNSQVAEFSLEDNVSPTIMGNLKTIRFEGISDPSEVLQGVSVPSISHFTIRCAITAGDALLQFASGPSLVELHIITCFLNPSILPTLLSLTPSIETLQVSGINSVVNEMFEFLTPRTVESPHGLPCRALKHVDVSHCSDLTTSSVYNFVKTRTQYALEPVGLTEKCVAVVSLKVDGCPNIEADMLPWFRSRVPRFSCVYATRKDFKKDRRRIL